MKKTLSAVLFTALLVIVLTSTAYAAYSSHWYIATDGCWHMKNDFGADIRSSWICENVASPNGDIWYCIDKNGQMVTAPLIQDAHGDYYFMETAPGDRYGTLRAEPGYYDGIYLDIETARSGHYGRIRNESAITALSEKFGLLRLDVANTSVINTISLKEQGSLFSAAIFPGEQKEILSGLNALRAEAGAPALVLDEAITQCSKIRCLESASLFSHERPDGRSCETVLDDNKIEKGRFGEILAHGYGSSSAVLNGWKGSEPHYKIIINPIYTKVGISMCRANGTTYYECFFYAPSTDSGNLP